MSWFSNEKQEEKEWENLEIIIKVGLVVLAIAIISSKTAKAALGGAILGAAQGAGHELLLESLIENLKNRR